MIIILKIQTINARASAIMRGGRGTRDVIALLEPGTSLTAWAMTSHADEYSRFQGRPSHRVASLQHWLEELRQSSYIL